MKRLVFYIIVITTTMVALNVACTEKIELDVDQAQPVYVIEALVSNQMKRHSVSITKSIGFYEESTFPTVANANVFVENGDGEVYEYIYDAESQKYISGAPFAGKVGSLYKLVVEVDGQMITASDTLRRVTKIDTTSWYFDLEEYNANKDDEERKGAFYRVRFSAKEPKDGKDFYQFKSYKNGKFVFYSYDEEDWDDGIYVSDDIVIVENIEDYPIPGWYNKGDTAVMEMYSLTPAMYRYYTDLSTLHSSDGGMFGPIPANPQTNLIGKNVTGYFQVSSIASDTIIVGKE